MGIYNRDYYRDWASGRGAGGWGLEGLTPVLKFLLIANVAVFLLQIFLVREVRYSQWEMLRKYNPDLAKLLTKMEDGDPAALEAFKKKHPEYDKLWTEDELDKVMFPGQNVSIIQEWFELDTDKVVYGGQVWRLLTHAFCHDRYSVWHILFNMLCLYWFGSTLETMYGSREFLLFYLTAVVVSALAFVGLDLYTGSSIPGIGASGAVMAVMMAYTVHFPYSIIYICWVIPVEMRWLMVLYVIWDLHPVLLTLAGDRMFTGIAHAAHLGGLAFGFLYVKYHWRLAPLGEWIARLRCTRFRQPRLRLAPDTLPDRMPETEMERVDEVLQKILASGQASLTEEEQGILRRASARISGRSKGQEH